MEYLSADLNRVEDCKVEITEPNKLNKIYVKLDKDSEWKLCAGHLYNE